MPENPRSLSRYWGFRYRKLNRQAASRLVELFKICQCSVCGCPLERDQVKMLLGESDLIVNGIEPAETMKFSEARLVWIPNVELPVIFCESDYQAWLNPASKENRRGL